MGDIESKDLHELSRDEARQVLEAFLIEGERRMPEWSAAVGFPIDYSEQSVCALFHYALGEIGREFGPDPIVEADYPRFNSAWLMRLAWYFGQALITRSPRLRWDLGDAESAFENHPVIAGFKRDAEAPLIVITRNITFSVLSGISPADRIDKGVESWFAAAGDAAGRP